MIFSNLQTAIVDRLLWDAWFTDPGKDVSVLAQITLDIKNEWKRALLKATGAVVLVNTIGCKPTQGLDLVDIPVILQISENVTLNRGKTGSQKPGADIAAKCVALLRGWTPNKDVFAPFLLWGEGLSYLGEEEADSIDHWLIELRTQTMLTTEVTGIGSDAAISDELGRALIMSPTDA